MLDFFYVFWFETYLACYPPLSHTGPTCHPGTSSGADQPEPHPHRRCSGQTDPEHWCWSSGRGTSSWINTQGKTWLITVQISCYPHIPQFFGELQRRTSSYSWNLHDLTFHWFTVVKRSTTDVSENMYVLKMWLDEEQILKFDKCLQKNNKCSFLGI